MRSDPDSRATSRRSPPARPVLPPRTRAQRARAATLTFGASRARTGPPLPTRSASAASVSEAASESRIWTKGSYGIPSSLEAGAEAHLPAIGVYLQRQLGRNAALSHPRLTQDDGNEKLPLLGAAPQLSKLAALAVTGRRTWLGQRGARAPAAIAEFVVSRLSSTSSRSRRAHAGWLHQACAAVRRCGSRRSVLRRRAARRSRRW